MHWGLSCSDADSGVFEVVESLDWREDQVNRSLSASSTWRGGRGRGRVMFTVKWIVTLHTHILRRGLSLSAHICRLDPSALPFGVGAGFGSTETTLVRTHMHTSNVPHDFPLVTLPFLLPVQHLPNIPICSRNRLHFVRQTSWMHLL